jgi:hypothetical protein
MFSMVSVASLLLLFIVSSFANEIVLDNDDKVAQKASVSDIAVSLCEMKMCCTEKRLF